jgi:hypothetical protein
MELFIPANFSDSVRQGKRVDLTLVKGGGAPDRLLEVQSRLTQAIVRFTKGLVQTDIADREWNDASKAELKAALERPQLLTVSRQSHRTLRPPPTGFSQSLPGMLVMFVVQMILTYGGESLVRDRRGRAVGPSHGSTSACPGSIRWQNASANPPGLNSGSTAAPVRGAALQDAAWRSSVVF